MSVIATITTSVDGFVTGPEDGPSHGLGIGGERLHYWVMGGPWTYGGEHDPGAATGADREFIDDLTATMGAAICGRNMYEAAGAWGGTNPFGGTLFVVTHRTEDAPDPSTGFVFVDDLARAVSLARVEAGDRDVGVSGGADIIRQCLAAGDVDELAISTAPVLLGAGKRLFDGLELDLDLEIRRVYTSQYATHVRYAVVRPG
jgi:dihydrofolate reductase